MGGGPKDYIEFADAGIGAYFAERYGDGIGITYDEAAAITEFDSDLKIPNVMSGSTCTFNELNYFTGLLSIVAAFCNSENVTIDTLELPNLVSVGGSAFAKSHIAEINCPKLATLGTQSLSWYAKRITMGDAYTEGGASAFVWMDDLEYLYLPNLKTITGLNFIASCTSANLKVYIASSSIPTIDSSIASGDYQYIFNGNNSAAKLYVKSSLLSKYKAAGLPWSKFGSILAM